MRWLAITTVLLAASAALVVGIYVRDRDPNAWHPPAPQLARGDAVGVLSALQGWHCSSGCAVEQVRPDSDGLWFARLDVHWRPTCVDIDLRDFAIKGAGFTGVRYVVCTSATSGLAATG